MTWLSVLVVAACVLLIVQIGLLWRNLNVARALQHGEARIGHLSDALALLTETSEAGFRTMANEIERLVEAGARTREPRANVARMAAAVRRGRPVAEVAAAEGVSEGEVSLRLHLAEQRPTRGEGRKARQPKGTTNGTLRAD